MEDINQENEPLVNIQVTNENAWLIVDLLRLRGYHELANEVIDAIDNSVNVEIGSEGPKGEE